MNWRAKPKPLAAIAAALILAAAGVAVQGRQQPAPGGAREQAKTPAPPTTGAGGAAEPDMAANRALARQQLALINEALAALHQLGRNGGTSLSDPSFSLWGRRLLETLRKTGAGKAEIVAALEKYFDIQKQEEAMAEFQHKSARVTQLVVFDVRFRRMEAEMWLNEEKAR
jgi:hypothetical protein